jgi:Fe-S-cluster containining protein
MEKKFPDGMVPLGSEQFKFSCHEGVACFTRCCRQVDMYLFPYDIIRLKNALKIDSHDCIKKYTRLVQGDNPYFPAVMLKLNEENICPFLGEGGCSVYDDRPSACRTYPLERAVDRTPTSRDESEFYFMTQHEYCLGHNEENDFTVKEWVRNQRLEQYNLMNDLWGELDTVFSKNPWRGEGSGGEKQRLAFMVCFDIDGFRNFVKHHDLLDKFKIDKDTKRRIREDDQELLKFGFEWLKLILTGKTSLVQR